VKTTEGRFLGEAKVSLAIWIKETQDQKEFFGKTDEHGWARFQGIPRGKVLVQVSPQYAARILDSGKWIDTYDYIPLKEGIILVDPGEKATGRLVDTTGKPVGNAEIQMIRLTSSEYDQEIERKEDPHDRELWNRPFHYESFHSTWKTDAAGRFSLPGVVPGQPFYLKILLDSKLAVVTGWRNEWKDIRIVLPAKHRVAGTVDGPDIGQYGNILVEFLPEEEMRKPRNRPDDVDYLYSHPDFYSSPLDSRHHFEVLLYEDVYSIDFYTKGRTWKVPGTFDVNRDLDLGTVVGKVYQGPDWH